MSSSSATLPRTGGADTSLLTSAVSFASSHRWLLLKSAVWLVGWRVFIALEFGAVYAAVSAIVFVFANLSSSTPTGAAPVSAYSAFNRGGARMAGVRRSRRHSTAGHMRSTAKDECSLISSCSYAGSMSMESWESQWRPMGGGSAPQLPQRG